MFQRFLGFTSLTFTAFCLLIACKNEGGAAAADGGATPKKLTCRMDRQCWICPDEAAIKKCIINPVTSGCTKGRDSDCSN